MYGGRFQLNSFLLCICQCTGIIENADLRNFTQDLRNFTHVSCLQ